MKHRSTASAADGNDARRNATRSEERSLDARSPERRSGGDRGAETHVSGTGARGGSDSNRLLRESLLDPESVFTEERRQARHWRFEVVQSPLLRLYGALLVVGMVGLHHLLLGLPSSPAPVFQFAGVAVGYASLSWLALYLGYNRIRTVSLPDVLLFVDVAVLILGIYLTGADKSWLFLFLLFRAVDHTNGRFRRALFYNHVAVGAYLLLLAGLDRLPGRAVPWETELLKIAALYGTGLYVALSARTAEQMRERTKSAIEVARGLILQLRQKATVLETSRTQAEDENRAKTELLANVSQEIRTPMNGIIGLTDLTLSTRLSYDQRTYLTSVRSSADTLLRVLNDVLDLSKIEAGSLDMEQVEFDVRQIVGEALRTIAPKAHAKGLELECRVARDVPELVVGDPVRFRQILLNLVSNAVHLTREGEVVVDVLHQMSPDGSVELRLSVSDASGDLDPETIDGLYAALSRTQSTIPRYLGGMELSLAIASKLASMMRGTLRLERRTDAGNVFHLRVSLGSKRREEPVRPAPVFHGLGSQKVVVADGGALSGSVLVETLAAHGILPEFVDTADAAWECMSRIYEDGHSVALAFLDYDLVDSEGERLGRRFLRKWGSVGNTVLLARMNSPVDPSQWAGGEHQTSVLYKPILERDVLRVVEAALARQSVEIGRDDEIEEEDLPDFFTGALFAGAIEDLESDASCLFDLGDLDSSANPENRKAA